MSLMTPDKFRTLSYPEMLPTIPFWNQPRQDTLVSMLGELEPDGTVTGGIPRVRAEWNRAVKTSNNYVITGPISPFKIRSTYGDPEGQAEDVAKVDNDFNACADLAYKWLFLGDVAAGDKACQIIAAWSGIVSWDLSDGATAPLVWSSRIPRMIQASFMLKNHPSYTEQLDTSFKSLITRGIAAGASSSQGYMNNVGAWGVVHDIAAAKILNNRPMLVRALYMWRYIFDDAIQNNVPIHEVYRQQNTQGDGSYGLWYSNFLAYALTVGAEWARYCGEWLYDYTGKDGSTFRGVIELVRYWTRNPELFPYNTSGKPSSTVRSLPHDEITHALWPNADSQWILDNYPNTNDRDSHGGRGFALIYRNRPLYG